MTDLLVALSSLDTAILFFDDQHKLAWCNDAGYSLFPEVEIGQPWSTMQFPDGHLYRLHPFKGELVVGTLVECIQNEDSSIRSDNHVLQMRNQELESLLNAVSDELFVSDGDGRVLLVNHMAESLYQMRLDEIVGKTVFELEEQRVFYPSVTAMVLRERRPQTVLQKTKDGRNLAVTGTPVFDEDGSIIRVISAAIDLYRVASLHLDQGRPGAKHRSGSITPRTANTDLIAQSEPMRELLHRVRRVASTDTTVLLTGETGAGKNAIANDIHYASHRSTGPFVEINCATIPDTLFESELFGYDHGAFTGSNTRGKPGKVELANGGTLFLNEIGEVPLHLQSKLLDLLENHTYTRVGGVHPKTVDVRIIAATNRDLGQMVRSDKFRADLYYRLHVIALNVPPLRDRIDDVSQLCKKILSDLSARHNQPVKTLHAASLAALQSHPWPGNIRELKNVLEQVVVWSDSEVVLPSHLPPHVRRAGSRMPMTAVSPDLNRDDVHVAELSLSELVNRFERQLLEQAVEKWETSYAIAKNLRVSQPTISRKLKRYGLSTG